MPWWTGLAAGAGALAAGLLRDDGTPVEASETKTWNDNLAAQREFAQMGLRWRVDDAKAAGLHPLAALGASGASFTPSAAVGDFRDGRDYGFLRDVGQDVSRAISAKSTAAERELEKLRLEQEREKLNGMRLQNMGLVHKLNELESVPPMPVVGSDPVSKAFGIEGQSSNVVDDFSHFVPPQKSTSMKLGMEAGIGPRDQVVIDSNRHAWQTYQRDVGEAAESDWYTSAKMAGRKLYDHARHLLNWSVGRHHGPRSNIYREELLQHRPAAPEGYEFRYNPWWGNWVLHPDSGGAEIFD